MKNKLMAAAAVLAMMSASSVAMATDATDVKALKAQAAALKKQNADLEKRLNKIEQKQAVAPQAAPASTDFMGMVTKGPLAVIEDDGPICWKGVCIFGAVDAGVGWYSNALPQNDKLYVGQSLINKFATHPQTSLSGNNLAQTGLGIKGSIEVLPGLSGVFMASTGINPWSGQLANAPGSVVDNQGLNRNSYSNVGDGSRGGQAFNDQLYVGVASKEFGQLTFGRHKSLTNDLVGAYDPAGGSYAFSVIGYSGTPVAGLGDTADGRWDDSFKYRVEYGPARFGAMYKFADGNGGCNFNGTLVAPAGTVQHCYSTKNDAAQFDLGASYGGFDIDGVLGYYHQAVTTGTPLSAAQLTGSDSFTSNVPGAAAVTSTMTGGNSGTLSGTASDNTGGAIGAKYTWNQFKFFVGWAHAIYHNPADNVGIGASNDSGGYQLSSVTNAAFPHAKILDTEWTGVKYAYDPKTDIVVAYYHEGQNSYGNHLNNFGSTDLSTCSYARYTANGTTINGHVYAAQAAPRSSACSGTLDGASAYVDYHFTKRFDVYGGLMYSVVGGGMASGFANVQNWAPTVGARFTF